MWVSWSFSERGDFLTRARLSLNISLNFFFFLVAGGRGEGVNLSLEAVAFHVFSTGAAYVV